jgi:hypothetical protein
MTQPSGVAMYFRTLCRSIRFLILSALVVGPATAQDLASDQDAKVERLIADGNFA